MGKYTKQDIFRMVEEEDVVDYGHALFRVELDA